MITWLLLVLLVCKSTQDGNGQENGVLHCGAQNMTLTSSNQTLLLTWEDHPSCSAVHDGLIYELLVLIPDKPVHYEEVSVKPEQIGYTHSWNWTSILALECASVRLRSRYENHTSPWKQQQTLPGIETPQRPRISPQDKVLEVDSRFTFCCILPKGQIFDKMYLTGYNDIYMNTTKISDQTYALTVDLKVPSENTWTDVKCKSKTQDNGASVKIGYPPGDRDLRCETRDLESVDCHWTVGRSTHLHKPTVYQLLGRQCADGSTGEMRCSQKVQLDVGERNWTLIAQNELGTVELTDRADLTRRVRMVAPLGVTASTVNARNVSLEWRWTKQHYNNLSITCQVNVSHGETVTISESFGVGLHFAVANDLIPNWTYNVRVRCGTTQHFWKWGDWSTSVNFQTKGDVPDALDVWEQVKGNQITVVWKMPLANQSHGQIIDYEVTWAETAERDQLNKSKVEPTKHSLALILDTSKEHIITVTARNINGSSPPSTVTVPSASSNPDKTRVHTSRITGSNGGFNLSWSASPAASCGYTVDWCPTSGLCSVEWMKVPPNETNASIFSENFSDGVRYLLSVYACTQGAPVLLERREGYVKEERIEDGLFKSLKWKLTNSDVEVSWDPINLREQSAFIQGYVLYSLDNNNNIVVNVSTEDPKATSLTARNLKISVYKFTVKAQTAVGECGTAFTDVTLDSLTDNLIKAVLISLVTVFGLLSLTTIICYRHWTCIKRKVYPPIPKPVLPDKWLTSPGENFHPTQCHHSEAEVMDVPELHANPGELVNDYVSHENMTFIYTPTPKGYYNQPLKKPPPLSLTLPSTAIPSQPGLPSSPIRGVFHNLSYNLIMQHQKSKAGPGLQERMPLERSSSGYQPQSDIETFTMYETEEDPESPMSCVSTYILLPHSPSK